VFHACAGLHILRSWADRVGGKERGGTTPAHHAGRRSAAGLTSPPGTCDCDGPHDPVRPLSEGTAMRRLLFASIFTAGLAGTAHAQSVTCRDGTVLTGPKASATCAAHGGLPLGTPSGPTNYPTTPRPGQDSSPAATSARPRRAARDAAQPAVGAAPGGGPGQVWINTASLRPTTARETATTAGRSGANTWTRRRPGPPARTLPAAGPAPDRELAPAPGHRRRLASGRVTPCQRTPSRRERLLPVHRWPDSASSDPRERRLRPGHGDVPGRQPQLLPPPSGHMLAPRGRGGMALTSGGPLRGGHGGGPMTDADCVDSFAALAR